MMIVSSSSLFVNRLRVPRSAGAAGRSSSGFFFGFGSRAAAYKARCAAIVRMPATSVSPEIAAMKPFAVIAGYAAIGVETADSPKYTSSGVRYSRV
jgi:hypothetical protein